MSWRAIDAQWQDDALFRCMSEIKRARAARDRAYREAGFGTAAQREKLESLQMRQASARTAPLTRHHVELHSSGGGRRVCQTLPRGVEPQSGFLTRGYAALVTEPLLSALDEALEQLPANAGRAEVEREVAKLPGEAFEKLRTEYGEGMQGLLEVAERGGARPLLRPDSPPPGQEAGRAETSRAPREGHRREIQCLDAVVRLALLVLRRRAERGAEAASEAITDGAGGAAAAAATSEGDAEGEGDGSKAEGAEAAAATAGGESAPDAAHETVSALWARILARTDEIYATVDTQRETMDKLIHAFKSSLEAGTAVSLNYNHGALNYNHRALIIRPARRSPWPR